MNGTNPRPANSHDTIWALKDVSFEIKRGEVVGVIGRNGAGKTTLLKIFSRITAPTEGEAEIRGRVGSLLEVGTGFHPELTGRENIYLNGAILGMRKAEIERKFDEIVAFAEIEKFIDTPVKRYSSGMYVRLAFAVAAHLEPEILVVDEVLAVGDVEFQKKCLGKVNDVAQQGRTVLFVSHNMAAVRALCNRGLILRSGRLTLDTDVESAIATYLVEDTASDSFVIWDERDAPRTAEVQLLRAYITNSKGEYTNTIDCREDFTITVEYKVLKPTKGLRVGLFMQSADGVPICGSNDPYSWVNTVKRVGLYANKCTFPGNVLNAGYFLVRFGVDMPPFMRSLITTHFCLGFRVEDVEGHGPRKEPLPGFIRPRLDWEVVEISEGSFVG